MAVYIIGAVLLIGLMIGYLRIARHYKIYDIPNHRSSHNDPVIRGGGIVFYLAILYYQVVNGFNYLFFFLGLTILAAVSFIDDLNPLSNRLRFFVQALAVALIYYQVGSTDISALAMLIIFVLCVGTMNTFNFMDGINGITGFYGLVTLFSLLLVNELFIDFIDKELLIFTIMGLMVFGFGNFRKQAIWFAGDIGSMALAYVVIFGLLSLILFTGNFVFILFLAVYGVDSVLTIILRLSRRENIFQAHRSHLYQYLVNTQKLPHLQVAGIYASLQAFINAIVLCNLKFEVVSSWLLLVVVLGLLSMMHLIFISRFVDLPKFRTCFIVVYTYDT